MAEEARSGEPQQNHGDENEMALHESPRRKGLSMPYREGLPHPPNDRWKARLRWTRARGMQVLASGCRSTRGESPLPNRVATPGQGHGGANKASK